MLKKIKTQIKNVNALTTIGEIKVSINNSLKNTVNEAINNSEVINKKINLIIGETLPETRDKNTLYFKVTENIQPTISNVVKANPNMGLKIEE